MNIQNTILNLLKYLILPVGVLFYLWTKSAKDKVSKIDTSNAQIADELAGIYANQLYLAMSGFGTDENVITRIFSTIDSEDFKLIYKKYDIKPYLWLGSAPELLGYPYDLVKWLEVDFGFGNEDINRIIRNAGFVYGNS